MSIRASKSESPSWFLALPPIALAVLELWHPVIHSGTPTGLEPLVSHADTWTIVHLAQLVLFGLTAWAVAKLVPNEQARLARVAKGSLAVFAVAYSAFDTFAGLATVTVIQAGQALQPTALPIAIDLANALFHSPINATLFLVGTTSWTLGAGLTAYTLLKQGASRAPTALLAVAALTLWGDHPPPFGPMTFGLVAAAILWISLLSRARRGESPPSEA